MSITFRYGIGQSMTKNIDLPIKQAITKFEIDIQDGTNLNKFVRIKVNYNTKQGTYLTFLKDEVGSAETFEVVKDKSGKPVFLQFSEVSKLEENKEQQIMQRITESQLRTIIKKELTEVLQGTLSTEKIFNFILEKYKSYVPLFKEQPLNVKNLINSLKDLLQSPQNGVKNVIKIEPPSIYNGMIYGSFVQFEATDGKEYKFNYAPSISTLVDMQTNQIVYKN